MTLFSGGGFVGGGGGGGGLGGGWGDLVLRAGQLGLDYSLQRRALKALRRTRRRGPVVNLGAGGGGGVPALALGGGGGGAIADILAGVGLGGVADDVLGLGGLGGIVDALPGGLEESGTGVFGPDLFAPTSASARQRMIDAPHPTSGERVFWRPVGRPILFSGDLALLKRTRKVVGRFCSPLGVRRSAGRFRRRRR